MSNSANIEMIPKLIPLFSQPNVMYRCSWGGRGSGKTRGFATMSAVKGYMYAEAGISGVILCGREFMNTLSDSSMEEIKQAIKEVPFLNDYYEMGENYIRTKNRKVEFLFCGLRHNLDSIKSKARILLCWVDEAESVSQAAWDKLEPTIRGIDDAEIWVTWNPEKMDSPCDKKFRHEKIYDPDTGELIGVGVEINWRDNPRFPKILDRQRRLALRNLTPEKYNWIWEGAYNQNSDAQIFANKYVVSDFAPDHTWDGPYQGLDFGFSADPMAFVRCWINDGNLYIEYDCSEVGLETDHMSNFISNRVPNVNQVSTRADNSRPETISFLKRNGMPLVVPCEKGKGSVEDGIEFIKSFNKIIIHSRCVGTKQEFDNYSYKTDRLTGEVLTIIIDKWNHHIDALRYALEPIMKAKGSFLDLL
jgi:Phage terminase large subunit